MQFLFPFGCLPVVVPLLVSCRFRLERNAMGISYGIGNGVLAGIGGFALFAAYRTGGNTAVITTATAMYPLITVVLAVLLLRERLTLLQVLRFGVRCSRLRHLFDVRGNTACTWPLLGFCPPQLSF